MSLNPEDLAPMQWALPDSLEVPPDQLKLRLDFYTESIVMHHIDAGVITNRTVSAVDIASAMSRELNFTSGLLPPETLWWTHSRQGDMVALWRKPQLTRIGLQTQAFTGPRRFHIPMPGLVFICQSRRTPWVFAAKSRPKDRQEMLYQAPTFNVFQSGIVCPGTHDFPDDVAQIPASFFQSLFSLTGDTHRRSNKFPTNLLALWEDLEGKKRYPNDDLVSWGTISGLMDGTGTRSYW